MAHRWVVRSSLKRHLGITFSITCCVQIRSEKVREVIYGHPLILPEWECRFVSHIESGEHQRLWPTEMEISLQEFVRKCSWDHQLWKENEEEDCAEGENGLWGSPNTGQLHGELRSLARGTQTFGLHIYQSLDIGTLGRGCSMVEMTLYLKWFWWELTAEVSCQKPFLAAGRQIRQSWWGSESHTIAAHFYFL